MAGLELVVQRFNICTKLSRHILVSLKWVCGHVMCKNTLALQLRSSYIAPLPWLELEVTRGDGGGQIKQTKVPEKSF